MARECPHFKLSWPTFSWVNDKMGTPYRTKHQVCLSCGEAVSSRG